MCIIKLDNVYFKYASYEEEEQIEQQEIERKRQEKKAKKDKRKQEDTQSAQPFSEFVSSGDNAYEHKSADVFGGLGELPEAGDYAVEDLSLEIRQGEFVGLVGHNGSGKSTLAKLFNGLLLPNSGNIIVDGMNTKDEKSLFDIRKTVGMVFQNPDNQMIASIVEDDIAFGPENIGLPREEIRKRVDFALQSVGMYDHLHATPFKLSGGQKQRIAIAGILAIKPKVLVLDEATAMLDPKGRKEVIDVVKKLNKEEGMTIVNISHYMDEMIDCDRIIVLDNGKKVIEGSPKDVFLKREELQKIGLSVPPVMELAYMISQNGIDMPNNIYTIKELVDCICRLKQKI